MGGRGGLSLLLAQRDEFRGGGMGHGEVQRDMRDGGGVFVDVDDSGVRLGVCGCRVVEMEFRK